MAQIKTDNSHFEEKVILRLMSLNEIPKDQIRVLECFSGQGKIWKEVKKRSPKTITVVGIDVKSTGRAIMKGDNVKYLLSMDLNKFDIIDLDDYGSPFEQLEICFKRGFLGIVHVTYIQSGMGRISNGILFAAGFTKEMIKKAPTLLCQKAMKLMENYLAIKGIKQITGNQFVDNSTKNYFYFTTKTT